MPQISVILPVYNGMPYLAESVESVLNQTLTDYEFLICDDCSTDNSYKYLTSLNDKKIRIFRNTQNTGLFPTLNFLIKNCNSEYIKLWAQDDVMMPECLQEIVNYHKNTSDIAFSYFPVLIINQHGEIIDKPEIFEPTLLTPEGHAMSSVLHGSLTGNIMNVTLNKFALDKYGIFNENLKFSGDFELWCRLTPELNIGYINKYLGKLRRHGAQLSKQNYMFIYKLKENKPILQTFLKRIKPEQQEKALKALKWKIEPLYFNNLLFLLSQRKFNLAFYYACELVKQTNIIVLFIRWFFTKILKYKVKI